MATDATGLRRRLAHTAAHERSQIEIGDRGEMPEPGARHGAYFRRKESRHQRPIAPTPQSESMHNLGCMSPAYRDLPIQGRDSVFRMSPTCRLPVQSWAQWVKEIVLFMAYAHGRIRPCILVYDLIY